jgi:hypothetical protein
MLSRSAAAWLLLTIAALLLQLLPQAAAAAPPLELSKWNRAYKLIVSNIDSTLKDQYNLIEQTCVKDAGFGGNDAAAPLDACRYRQEKNVTYTKWTKKAGEWRMNTNCYCYALNVYRDGFCIPGRSSGAVTDALMSGQDKTCELMTAAVLADGAKTVSRAQALSAAQPPAGSHFIGLLVRNRSCMPTHCWQNDFHLVRKDDNGKWSWKEPGGRSVFCMTLPTCECAAACLESAFVFRCQRGTVCRPRLSRCGCWRHSGVAATVNLQQHGSSRAPHAPAAIDPCCTSTTRMKLCTCY